MAKRRNIFEKITALLFETSVDFFWEEKGRISVEFINLFLSKILGD